MRIIISIFLLLLITQSFGQSQQFPNPKSTGWSENGYYQNDSGFIPAKRDTNWIPKFTGTTVYWQHAGVDTAFWYWDMSKWNKIARTGAISTNYWGRTGNAGTSPTLSFLGTTDAISMRFRTNNVQRMIIDSVGLIGFGVIPTNPFEVLTGATSFNIHAGGIAWYDDINNLNMFAGNSAGGSASGTNTNNIGIGKSALKYVTGSSYNIGIGDRSLSDIDEADTGNIAMGYRSGVFGYSSNTSIGYSSNTDARGIGNTAIGNNTNNSQILYSGTLANTVIATSTKTFTGATVATYITATGLSVGDTSVYSFNFDGTAPQPSTSYSMTGNLHLGVITSSNTITLLNAVNFTSQGTGNFVLVVWTKQSNAIALGNGAVTTRSNQLAISPYIDTIYAAGMATGTGYVLTDVGGNGKLVLKATTLSGSATLNFPSTLATAVADLTITVTGAADGDVVILGVPNAAITATSTYTAWVSAANTVSIRFSPKATEDPASATFKVKIIK